MTPEPIVFALSTSVEYGERIARGLDVPLAHLEERDFEDGEHKTRPLVNVRRGDVYVVESLYGGPERSVNDKLVRLLFFLGALRDASAAHVTALIPYLGYSRKDQKTQPRDPVTTRYVAGLFESVGVDRVVTVDVHNLAAFQNAFRCRTDHLEARPLFVRHFAETLRGKSITVVSPDAGGLKRATRFRDSLARAMGGEIPIAFMEKTRAKGVVRGDLLVGDVKGRTVVIYDDLIATGTTLARAAAACRDAGAAAVHAAASHGTFVGEAAHVLGGSPIASLAITDTIPPFRVPPGSFRDRLVILDSTPLFIAAVRAIHEGGSIVELFL